MTRGLIALLTAILLAACSSSDPFVVSVLGTNDVHGQLVASGDRGGIVTFSGYVSALRAARREDGGAVLLIDAGDMWQGTLESNLSEGAAVVEAYNALGYTAVAVGNHEFDFGPDGPAATPTHPDHDPRGALQARAAEAEFPMLAANLIDSKSGELVDWENVRPTALVEVGGVKIGIIGVMTQNALRTTISLNVDGLRVTPLAPAIEKFALELRDQGATLVIVTAHAGGECEEFDDPYDLSSCKDTSEIFAVAEALPTGLVDHIIAGHNHHGIAHVVNGVAITSSYSSTRAFGRVDFAIDRRERSVTDRRIFPPHKLEPDDRYEGQPVLPDADVVSIAERAVLMAKRQRESRIGIHLSTPFTLEGNPESALGNLFTDALLESTDADIAIHNVAGGLRKNLPAGDLMFADVYELSPFENRLVIAELTGRDLRRVIAEQAHKAHRSVGFSGLKARVSCDGNKATVKLQLDDGRELSDDDSVRIAINDYLATGGDSVFATVMPEDGYAIDPMLPLTRDVFVDWLRNRGGSIRDVDFLNAGDPKWIRPQNLDKDCRL